MLVGFDTSLITPTTSLSMDGYADRLSKSTGVLHDLYVKTCAIHHESTYCIMVSVDILGVDHHVVATVKNEIHKHYNLDPNAIFINASHTHAAPQAARFGDLGGFFIKENPTQEDLKYYEFLQNQIIQSIHNAIKNQQECTIEFVQQTIHGVSSNRVMKDEPFNNNVSLFLFKNSNRDLIGCWTIFANHPTILDASNTLFSNDFISYYHQGITVKYPLCTSMFLQGCAGNISSRHTKKASSEAEAKRLADLMISQITPSFEKATALDNSLYTTQQEIVFKTKKFDPTLDFDDAIQQAYHYYLSLKEKNMESSMVRSAYVSYQGKKMQKVVKEKLRGDSITSVVGKIELGNITIITTPSETFSAIDFEIQKTFNKTPTIVLGYTNGYVGYLVDDSLIDNEDVYERNMMVIDETSHQKLLSTIKNLK